MIEFRNLQLAVCLMYCPPQTSNMLIIENIKNLKSLSNSAFKFICCGDFNINLLNVTVDSTIAFVDDLHTLSLHPLITLPTRVSDSSSTLIDNFFCNFNLLPLNSAVIQTDISDHYTIAVQLNDNSRPSKRWARNYSNKCKNKFTADLQTADWSKLYSIQSVDEAFAYFINKLKRIYNKSFPFTQFSVTNKKPPWLTSAILKSIRHKNKLFIQSKTNPELKESYASYRNQLNDDHKERQTIISQQSA